MMNKLFNILLIALLLLGASGTTAEGIELIGDDAVLSFTTEQGFTGTGTLADPIVWVDTSHEEIKVRNTDLYIQLNGFFRDIELSFLDSTHITTQQLELFDSELFLTGSSDLSLSNAKLSDNSRIQVNAGTRVFGSNIQAEDGSVLILSAITVDIQKSVIQSRNFQVFGDSGGITESEILVDAFWFRLRNSINWNNTFRWTNIEDSQIWANQSVFTSNSFLVGQVYAIDLDAEYLFDGNFYQYDPNGRGAIEILYSPNDPRVVAEDVNPLEKPFDWVEPVVTTIFNTTIPTNITETGIDSTVITINNSTIEVPSIDVRAPVSTIAMSLGLIATVIARRQD